MALTKSDFQQIRSIIKEEINPLDKKIAGLDQKVTGLDQKVDGLEQKMDKGFKRLGKKIDKLEKKVDYGVNFLDNDYLEVKKRVGHIEEELSISAPKL